MKALNTLEIQKKNSDYDYVTLNFSRFILKNQLSKFVDFIDSKERIDVRQYINQKQMSDFAENEKFENFEIESDLKSHDDIIFDETRTSQLLKQHHLSNVIYAIAIFSMNFLLESMIHETRNLKAKIIKILTSFD